jgi:hypothetical protein
MKKLSSAQYRPCIIYAIQGGEGGPVKIGYCREGALNDRLASLQVGNPNFLKVRKKVHAQWLHEGRLHNEIQSHFIRGEWYQADALIRFQELIASDFFAPVDVPENAKGMLAAYLRSCNLRRNRRAA